MGNTPSGPIGVGLGEDETNYAETLEQSTEDCLKEDSSLEHE